MPMPTDYGHTKSKSLFAAQIQIQIPIPNKYLGCGFKGLVFCRNNGQLMEKSGQGTHSTKMGADKSAENAPKLFIWDWDLNLDRKELGI